MTQKEKDTRRLELARYKEHQQREREALTAAERVVDQEVVKVFRAYARIFSGVRAEHAATLTLAHFVNLHLRGGLTVWKGEI